MPLLWPSEVFNSSLTKNTNTPARILSNFFRFSHITQTLKFLHWLPIFCCVNFIMCCITHLLLFWVNHFILVLRLPINQTHSLRSNSFSPLLLLYFNKKSNIFRIFSFAAPFFWNQLPNTFCSAPTYMSFRRNFKT